MAQPVIVDLRNIYRDEEMKRAQFRYFGIGRAPVVVDMRRPGRG
jgi:hypothetical protein